jgi:Pectate lyase superfamily protein
MSHWTSARVLLWLCAGLGLAALWGGMSAAATPITEEEFVGPFPSWANVKTTYGAIGNGMANDTNALQRALNEVGTSGHASVLYLPAGTYRITKTLTLSHRINVSLIGEDPTRTILKWDAITSNGVMLFINGVAYSRFNRLTWHGSGKALVAVDQSYDGGAPHFDTGNEYADDVFQDVGYGIRGGNLGHGFAETAVIRSKFIRNSQAGIILKNFNALDLYVWYATFQDCKKGITNTPGAGNYRVYNSLFQNSTVTDLEIGNTGGFSARHNTSIGSNAFLTTTGTANPAEINLQGNTIIDPKGTTAVSVGNQGPLFLLDNVFRSLASVSQGPIVSHSTWTDSDTIAIGNKFTVSNPIQVGSRLISINNTTVPHDSVNGGEPTQPSTPQTLNRHVFEVPVGASATVIQQVITNASLESGTRPVVHLPIGTYLINTTLSIPAGSDVQLVGDGHGDVYATLLKWTGSGRGPVMHIHGPTKATLRDLSVDGQGRADGIMADGLDQPGARVFMHQAELRSGTKAHLFVDRLDYTKVDMRNVTSAYMSSGVSVQVRGGPQAAAGTPVGGTTTLFSGDSSSNALNYDISDGGQLLVRDVWYETSSFPTFARFVNTTGRFTLDGSRVALTGSQNGLAMVMDGFRGQVTVVTSRVDDQIIMTGDGSLTKVLALGIVGDIPNDFVNNSAPAAQTALLNSRQLVSNVPGNGSLPMPNQGAVDPVFIKDMIEQTRQARPEFLTTLAAGVSDLRFFRVWVRTAPVGIHLLP